MEIISKIKDFFTNIYLDILDLFSFGPIKKEEFILTFKELKNKDEIFRVFVISKQNKYAFELFANNNEIVFIEDCRIARNKDYKYMIILAIKLSKDFEFKRLIGVNKDKYGNKTLSEIIYDNNKKMVFIENNTIL